MLFGALKAEAGCGLYACLHRETVGGVNDRAGTNVIQVAGHIGKASIEVTVELNLCSSDGIGTSPALHTLKSDG